MLDDLYILRQDEVSFWGQHYVGPPVGTRLPDGGWTKIAGYASVHEDGADCDVYIGAAPARFYRVRCPAKNIDLGTGSSELRLARDIAEAIAEAMLSNCAGEPL
jgi:hypothetical protein